MTIKPVLSQSEDERFPNEGGHELLMTVNRIDLFLIEFQFVFFFGRQSLRGHLTIERRQRIESNENTRVLSAFIN